MSCILEALSGHARKRPAALAVSGRGMALSYAALGAAVAEAARRLEAASDGPGPLAIALDNGPHWVLLDLACIALDRTSLPLPPFFTAAQTAHALADGGAVALITDRRQAGKAPHATLDIADRQLYLYRRNVTARRLPAGTAKITFSSGTTGRPKGVCLSRASMERVARSLLEVIGSDFAGVHFAALPLGILLENVAGLYTTLLAGGQYHTESLARIGFARPFSPDFAALAGAIGEARATTTILVPEVLRGLLATLAEGAPALDTLRLVAVGGARVSPGLLEMAQRAGLPVVQGYGLSEAASVVALNRPGDNCPGSVGRALPHLDVRLAEDGEIILGEAPFLGYVGGPLPKSPYPTGDLGYFGPDGHLYVSGRKDHLIVNAFGRNIAPEWVESEILTRPEVAQAVVFGAARPALSALIVPAGPEIDDADIERAIAAVNAALPVYAHVHQWRRVAPFTVANGQLTGTGRPRRLVLEETYRAMLNENNQPPAARQEGFFERLVRETEGSRNALMRVPQIADGLQGRISRETYIAYLAEAWHHVRHTVPLLSLARDRLPADKAWLARSFSHYIDEERGHEQWILDDIGHAGGDPRAVATSQPRMATEVMISYAYDTVNRLNPAALLGMVFVLEGTSTALATQGAEAVMKRLGLPPACFRYLLSHGALDIKHMAFFKSLMGQLDDPRDKAAILHMANRMFALYGALFQSIPHSAEAQYAA